MGDAAIATLGLNHCVHVQDIADQRQMQNESLQQQVELNTGAEDSLTEKLVASRCAALAQLICAEGLCCLLDCLEGMEWLKAIR